MILPDSDEVVSLRAYFAGEQSPSSPPNHHTTDESFTTGNGNGNGVVVKGETFHFPSSDFDHVCGLPSGCFIMDKSNGSGKHGNDLSSMWESNELKNIPLIDDPLLSSLVGPRNRC